MARSRPRTCGSSCFRAPGQRRCGRRRWRVGGGSSRCFLLHTDPPLPPKPLHLRAQPSASPAPPLRLRTITTAPPLELTAAHFALNRSGTYAAVAGSALEDPEISRVLVVDLTNCRPAPTSAGAAGAAPASAPGRHDLCEATLLDAELFAGRPGLRVLQVGWHPDSDAHLAVLTSGAGAGGARGCGGCGGGRRAPWDAREGWMSDVSHCITICRIAALPRALCHRAELPAAAPSLPPALPRRQRVAAVQHAASRPG